MMIRLVVNAVTVALATLAPLASAHAQTATTHAAYACPAVKDIVAKPGVSYSAPAANGKQWTGEDPMAPDDIQIKADNTRFKGGHVSASKTVVMCDYAHAPAGAAGQAAGAVTQVRLALDLKKEAGTTGDRWKAISLPNSPVSQRCDGQTPEQCTFN